MRPYLAIVKDSFREALRSPVLWISLLLITLCLAALSPAGVREETTTQLSLVSVANWEQLATRLVDDSRAILTSPGKHIWSKLDAGLQKRLGQLDVARQKDRQAYDTTLRDLRTALNDRMLQRDFYDASAWRGVDLGKEGKELVAEFDELSSERMSRLNRVAIERAFPELIFPSPAQSTVLTYAGRDVNPDWLPPVKPEQFQSGVRLLISRASNWFIGGVGILVALIITAHIIPRMFDQGQLHLLLSKPVSRSMLLVAQYLGACFYIAVIVSYLTVGLWLILGLRLKTWEASLVWIIPIYILTFGLYYVVSLTTAVITRSSIVAIIVSMLFWVVCFGVGTAKLELDRRARVQQFNRLIPAGDQLLSVNEHNTVFAWNGSRRAWDKVFVSRFQQDLQKVSWLPLPAMPPMPGVVYNQEKQEIVAVERSLESPLSATLAIGRKRQDWAYTPGGAPPLGTFALVQEPDGSILLGAGMGLFRLRGDPTTSRKPVKVLGMELPLTSGAVYQDVSPVEGLTLAPPASLSIDRKSGEVFLYSRGEVLHLRPGKSRFEIVKRTKIDAKDTETIVLGVARERIFLGRADGRMQTLNRASLKEISSEQLDANSRVRFIETSPDGRRAAAVLHNKTLWLFDSDADAWQRAPLPRQRAISTVQWSDEGLLFVADDSTRVNVFEGQDLKFVKQYSPSWSIISTAYRYAITPLYYVLPKPGELYKTFEHLVRKPEDAEQDPDIAMTAQPTSSPLMPVWSGVAFVVVVLSATCIYFERQEY